MEFFVYFSVFFFLFRKPWGLFKNKGVFKVALGLNTSNSGTHVGMSNLEIDVYLHLSDECGYNYADIRN